MASPVSIESFRLAAKNYLQNEWFCDFTIACEGKEWKVHRCFISPHSKWFEKCCSGKFEENQTNRVELKEDFKEVVEKMITFFYTFDYDDTVVEEGTDLATDLAKGRPTNRLQMNAWVYAVADKYEVTHLKALALEKFKQHANITNADEMFRAAWTICTEVSLPENDRVLHDLIVNMWLLGGKDLAVSVVETNLLYELITLPEFMTRVHLRLMSAFDAKVKQYCKQCNRYEVFERAEVMSKGFFCKACKGTETKEGVTLSGTLSVQKYW